MTVDVIIPTYKPDETFRLLLQKLQGQTFVVHRVIILNTEQSLWEAANKKYGFEEELGQADFPCSLLHIPQAEFDHGGTRTYGASQSDADVILFMTQDAMPADEHLIENLVKAFETPNNTLESKYATGSTMLQMDNVEASTASLDKRTVVVAYARQLPNDTCHIVEKYTRQFNYPQVSRIKGKEDIPEMGIKTFFCSDVCAAYRRDIFNELGGFESPVIFNEDMLFAAKAVEKGYYVKYAADAEVIHSHNYSMKQQFHRNFDLGVSQKQHPEIFEHISSESEGMKLVKSTVSYLFHIRKPWLIFHLGFQCVGKYAGFRMGKRYESLSREKIMKYTMNPGYWKLVWNHK